MVTLGWLLQGSARRVSPRWLIAWSTKLKNQSPRPPSKLMNQRHAAPNCQSSKLKDQHQPPSLEVEEPMQRPQHQQSKPNVVIDVVVEGEA